MTTETVEYTFTVKEGYLNEAGGKAPVFIMCEPNTPEFNFLGVNGFLTIKLKEGTSVNEGQIIAEYLRQHVKGISATTF